MNLWCACPKWQAKRFRLTLKHVWCAAMYSFEEGSYCKSRAAERCLSLAGPVLSATDRTASSAVFGNKLVAPILKYVFSVPDFNVLFIKMLTASMV